MYSKNWIVSDYCKIFELETGAKPNNQEKDYLENFLNYSEESKSKEIFYLANYRLRRWYPIFIVHYLIVRSIKIHFIKTNAPDSLISLDKTFGKYTLNQVIKAYCKIKE